MHFLSKAKQNYYETLREIIWSIGYQNDNIQVGFSEHTPLSVA